MVLQMRENTAPFDNPKVRAALEYAVNRPAINKVVFDGLGEPAFQPFPTVVARLQQADRELVLLPAGEGQGHAGRRRLPPRRELQVHGPGR